MQQLTLNLALQPTFCSRESKSLRPADSSGGVWSVAQRTFKKEKDLCCIRVPRAEQTFEKFYSLITTRAVGVSHLQSTTCSSTVSDTVYSCTLSAWLLTGPTERIWTLSNSFIATLLSEAKARKNKRCRCEWTHGLTLVASVSFLKASLSLLSVIMYLRRCALSLVASKIINQKALNVGELLNFRRAMTCRVRQPKCPSYQKSAQSLEDMLVH